MDPNHAFFPLGLQGFGVPAPRMAPRFEAVYRAYPVAFINRPELEGGGKAHLNIHFPMLFELSAHKPAAGAKAAVHCGVLEFVAEEGHCYLPYWMMENLLLPEGGHLQVRSASLPAGSFVKLQPHTKTFLDISNPKAVLERELRNYSALTKGEDICISYNNKKYYLNVQEVRPEHPSRGISIVETDIQVDFAPPMDYVEPVRPAPQAQPPPPSEALPQAAAASPAATTATATAKAPEAAAKSFAAFGGGGYRLDGKPAPPPASAPVPTGAARAPAAASSASPSPSSSPALAKQAPAAAAAPKLVFGGAATAGKAPGPSPAAAPGPSPSPSPAPKPAVKNEPAKQEKGFTPFSGQGYRLQ